MTRDQLAELEAWRSAGARLFPYIRAFGLCGAAPQAIEAVEDIAGLLGMQQEAVVGEITHRVRLEVANEIAEWFLQAPEACGLLERSRHALAHKMVEFIAGEDS